MLPQSISVINLERATARWDAVRETHGAHLAGVVALQRLAAVDGQSDDVAHMRGRLSPAEKGCFQSHMAALRRCSQGPASLHWIAEDDVTFGPSTLRRLDGLLDRLKPDRWDILFTDVMVTGPSSALDMWGHFLACQDADATGIVDLADIAFGGTTSYIVNGRSVARILALVGNPPSLDTPWDLLLRKLCREKRLNAFTTMPFVTRSASHASQIQTQTGMLDWWSALRDLMSCDADPAAIAHRLDRLRVPATTSMLFGRIMAGMVDPPIRAADLGQRRIDSTARTSNAVRRSSVSNSASSDSTA